MQTTDSPPDFDGFEWDERKRGTNLQRHGIDFRDVARVFDDPVLTVRSDRGEMRWVAIGILDKQVISVIFTQRNKTCRIISARPARRKERAAYRALYPGGT